MQHIKLDKFNTFMITMIILIFIIYYVMKYNEITENFSTYGYVACPPQFTKVGNTLHMYYNDGNIGIGNDNPAHKLDIRSGDTYIAIFKHTNNTQGIGIGYNSINALGSNGNQDININARGSGVVRCNGELQIKGVNRTSHICYSNGNTYIRGGSTNGTVLLNDNGGGNVGIGTSNPEYKLDVNGEVRTNTGFTIGNSTRLYKDHLDFNYNNKFDNWGSVRWGCGNYQQGSYGKLYLASANNHPYMRLDCYTKFYIDKNCYAPAFVNTSDLRMKKNINNINSDVSLNKILQLSPISYDFIDETKGTKLFGFIAQDLINVVPEAVTTRGGYLPTIMKSFKYELNKIFIDEEEILNKIDINKYYAIGNSQLDSFTPYKILEKDLNSITIENPENNSFGEETLYIYGECSNDINSINYNHISVLNSGSIQELHSIIQNQQTQINQLLEILSRNRIS